MAWGKASGSSDIIRQAEMLPPVPDELPPRPDPLPRIEVPWSLPQHEGEPPDPRRGFQYPPGSRQSPNVVPDRGILNGDNSRSDNILRKLQEQLGGPDTVD